MKKRNQFFVLIFVFTIFSGLSITANAQKKVSGKVVDSKGAPVTDATISANGVTSTSGADGSFKISVSRGKNVVVSKSGYDTSRVSYSGESLLNVTLNAIITNASNSSKKVDSLPIPKAVPSLRRDGAVTVTFDDSLRRALPYEDLRSDDVVFRIRLWEEIDIRQKINLPFAYKGDEDNGNQRFISIILSAINQADTTKNVTVFNSGFDDRFTSPLTRDEIAQQILGDKEPIAIVDQDPNSPTYGQKLRDSFAYNEIDLDSSFQKFRIKEEVIFDRESSRLHWRILGIAPVKRQKMPDGSFMDAEIFWFYFPDLRPILAVNKVYNGKNFKSQKSWDDLFQERLFSSYIYKSSLNNFFNRKLSQIPGMKGEVNLLRLYESDDIKNKIFDLEQNAWSY
jgi:gliding motility associated protien GldN